MKRLFFDTETQANPESLSSMPEPEAPGNLRDPEKIAAAIEAKKLELIEKAALDPDYGKVLSVGFTVSNVQQDYTCLITGDVDSAEHIVTESEVIDRFWSAFDNCNGACVGYNILSFDLPFLIRRSFAIGVKPPATLPFMVKFRNEPVTDLYPILYNWQPGKSLKLVAKLYGLTVLAPDVDGSMVAKMTPGELWKYQISDVYLVQQLYNRMNGFYFDHPLERSMYQTLLSAEESL